MQAEPVTSHLLHAMLRLQVRLLAAEAAFDAGERGIAQHLLLLLNPTLARPHLLHVMFRPQVRLLAAEAAFDARKRGIMQLLILLATPHVNHASTTCNPPSATCYLASTGAAAGG
jgi:hypothetical protein